MTPTKQAAEGRMSQLRETAIDHWLEKTNEYERFHVSHAAIDSFEAGAAHERKRILEMLRNDKELGHYGVWAAKIIEKRLGDE